MNHPSHGVAVIVFGRAGIRYEPTLLYLLPSSHQGTLAEVHVTRLVNRIYGNEPMRLRSLMVDSYSALAL